MSDKKTDLNQADVTELAALPGIGEKMAAKIVEQREKQPFTEVAGLAAVSGISEQKASELADYLFVPATKTEAPAELKEVKKEEKKEEKAEKAEKAKATTKKKPLAKAKSAGSEQQLLELRTASRDGDTGKVKALLKDGVDGQDKFALLWAAQNGHDQVVVELIEAGADVNSKSAEGGTHALALAAQNGHLAVVQALVGAGADVNEPAMEGRTPLMKAAFFGHEKIANSLLLADAKIRIRDVHGQTAADYARKAGNQKIVALLSR